MNIDKTELIECPTCHAQYLPVEIFIPDAFFGHPTKIYRDENHIITEVVGQDRCSMEQYVCDYCNVPFKVNAKLQFSTKPEIKFDFKEDYSTKLKKESIFLKED